MGTICSSTDYSKLSGNIKVLYRIVITIEAGNKRDGMAVKISQVARINILGE